jgi:tetratricopeptide (TPR) repeat protein
MSRSTHRYHSCSLLLKPLLDELAHARNETRSAFDQHYAGVMGVSAPTLNAWKHGRSRPNTPDQFRRLLTDAVSLGRDRAWCEHFLESADASPALRQSLLARLFEDAPTLAPSARYDAPFLAPPLPLSGLMGREREVQAMRRQLTCEAGCTLAAVRGLPGMGKTTLAIALAHDADLRRRFADGVLWHGLGREGDVERGYARWARALGIELTGATSLTEKAEALHDAIGQRHMLLVIDDAWRAEDALAFELGGPNCAHLLTTRFPDIAHDFAGENTLALQALRDGDALKLFAVIAPDVAREARPTARALTALGGGLPLAVQVIARQAWRAHASSAGALDEFEQAMQHTSSRLALSMPRSPLEAPKDGGKSVSAISPLASISVSFTHLTTEQQQALASLALFPPKPNTFSLDAALGALRISEEAWQGLLNCGLIDSAGEDRFAVHQVIHDFLREQPLPEDAIQRHVHHWTHWILLNSRRVTQVENEWGCLMDAIKLAKTHAPACHATLVNGLYRTFNQRGRLAASVGLFDEALEVARACGDAGGEGWTQLNLGNLAWRLRDDYAAAAAHVQQAIPLLQGAGHIYKACDAQAALADILLDAGLLDDAQHTYEIALDQAQAIHEEQLVAHCLSGLGVLAARREDAETAIACFEQALPIAERSGYTGLVGGLLFDLGSQYIATHEKKKARAYLLHSVAFSRQHKLHAVAVLAMLGLSALAHEDADPERVERYASRAVRYARKHKATRALMHAHATLGRLYKRMGRSSQAVVHLNEALSAAGQLRNGKMQSEIEGELASIEHFAMKGTAQAAASHG